MGGDEWRGRRGEGSMGRMYFGFVPSGKQQPAAVTSWESQTAHDMRDGLKRDVTPSLAQSSFLPLSSLQPLRRSRLSE